MDENSKFLKNLNIKNENYLINENDLVEFICIMLGDGGLYTPPEYKSYTVSISLKRIDENL